MFKYSTIAADATVEQLTTAQVAMLKRRDTTNTMSMQELLDDYKEMQADVEDWLDELED